MSRTQSVLRRLFTTPYRPQPLLRSFLSRGQTQEGSSARVTVAVLDAAESEQVFGVPLARRGIQPVYLRVENRGTVPLRLHLVSINPNYFTALEAAAVNHFSIAKRLSAFGFMSWLILPLLPLIPLKLITAHWANLRMDDCFRSQAFRLQPILPGESSEGFVFTPLDAGTKIVHVYLHATGESLDQAVKDLETSETALADHIARLQVTSQSDVSLTFSIAVPGIAADYLRRDFAAINPPGSLVDCDVPTLVKRLVAMPATTTNRAGTRTGDPVNLVVIGEFATLLSALVARWDESETITLATCWKTATAFLLGSEYRYSPVSPLYLFGRSQDVALQRSRRSINERLHLRLWLTPLQFRGQSVWVGQISRDIGVRFTTRAWNLTTHRIDSDVDESRDYLVEDLIDAERIEVSGYVGGAGPCDASAPRHNLTGDPYFTDGKRAAILLSTSRTKPRFVAWG
ncbi:MAG: LssY C-terminal domain-containing protein [Planctomycetaceae bacterium]|nr:LssY C-terminal domain-containing protein [Planctomycetaceae bacterium]